MWREDFLSWGRLTQAISPVKLRGEKNGSHGGVMADLFPTEQELCSAVPGLVHPHSFNHNQTNRQSRWEG